MCLTQSLVEIFKLSRLLRSVCAVAFLFNSVFVYSDIQTNETALSSQASLVAPPQNAANTELTQAAAAAPLNSINTPILVLLLLMLASAIAINFRLRYAKAKSERNFAKEIAYYTQGQRGADIPRHMTRVASWAYDGQRKTISVSEGFCELLGLASSQRKLSTSEALSFVHEEDRASLLQDLEDCKKHQLGLFNEHRLCKKNGQIVFVEHYAETRVEDGHYYINGIVLDISRELASKQQLEQELYLCPLTQLSNRVTVKKLIDAHITADLCFAVLMIDLLSLKRINESLGMQEGDALIKAAAQRILSFESEVFHVSHVGGGQFVCVFVNKDFETIQRMAMQVINLFKEPFQLGALRISQSVNVGITVFPTDANSADDLMSCAFTALNDAKKQGRYRYSFYSRSLHARVVDRIKLESSLDNVIDNGELELLYQPQVDANSRKVVGAEALLRWSSAEFGPISPDEFITIAEHSEAIVPIGRWVIRESCRQLRSWKNSGFKNLTMAFNISPKQFTEPEFVNHILATLQYFDLSPSDIEIEITENLVVAAFHDFERQFNQLKQAGIPLAIDDFGTGYSSFAYLKDYAFDALKIDRSFVASYGSNGSTAIIKAIVGVGNALDMQVVAEGVEDSTMAGAMVKLGCSRLQGYVFSKPLSSAEFKRWLVDYERS